MRVHFKNLRTLFKPFGEMPKQSIEARLAGIGPFLYSKVWDVHVTNYFKTKIQKAQEKNSMLAMVAPRAEVPLNDPLELIMINLQIADTKKLKSKSSYQQHAGAAEHKVNPGARPNVNANQKAHASSM